jgi:hypothetical protein
MTTQITKTFGTGKDFTTAAALATYVNGLDPVALDQNVRIELFAPLTFPNSIGPVSSDDTRRVLITAPVGASVNALNPNTLDVTATMTGAKLTLPRYRYGLAIGPGLDLEDLILDITQDWGDPIFFSGHWAETFDNRVRRNRILDHSTTTSASFVFGATNNVTDFTDNLVVVEGAAGKVFYQDNLSNVVKRNTFVGRSTALNAMQVAYAQYGGGSILNCAFINCGNNISSTTIPTTNCYSNTTPTVGQIAGITVVTAAGGLVVNEASDFRPSATGGLINTATASANGTNDIEGNNRGTTPDVGAWELSPTIPSPTGTITSAVISNGTTVTLSGTSANTPTSGVATLTPTVAAYNSGTLQGPLTVTLGSGTFSAVFNNVPVGQYSVAVSLSNTGGTAPATNNAGIVNVVGATGTVTSHVLSGSVLTISGTTTGTPASGSIIVPPAAANAYGAIQQGPTALVLGTGTFSIQLTLPPGSYDPSIIRFTTAAGTSLPAAGTSAVSINGIDGNPASPAPAATVTSVSIVPLTPNVSGGGTQQFTATATGTNAPAQTFTWAVAGVGVVSATGVYTAPAATTAAQTATVTATSTIDATKSASTTVNIAALPTVTGVTISPTNPAVTASTTQQFTAVTTGTNSPAQTFTWSKTGAGTLSASGLYTAPSITSAIQTATITATSTIDATKSASTSVSVPAKVFDPLAPTVTSVVVSPVNPSVLGSTTRQFTAIASGTNNPAQTFTWAVNGFGAITVGGLLTTPVPTASVQTLMVTATSVVDPTQSGSTTVTVPIDPASLLLRKHYGYITNDPGATIPGAIITVKNKDGTLATLYADAFATSKQNPVTSGTHGYYEFYHQDGNYDFSVSGPGITPITLIDAISKLGTGGGGVGSSAFTPEVLLTQQTNGDVIIDKAVMGNVGRIVLTQNAKFLNPVGYAPGERITIAARQGALGPFSVTWGLDWAHPDRQVPSFSAQPAGLNEVSAYLTAGIDATSKGGWLTDIMPKGSSIGYGVASYIAKNTTTGVNYYVLRSGTLPTTQCAMSDMKPGETLKILRNGLGVEAYGAIDVINGAGSFLISGALPNGNRAELRTGPGIRPAYDRGVIVAAAGNITVQDLILSGAREQGQTPGIAQGLSLSGSANVTAKNLRIYDNENGILSANDYTGNFTVTDSEFEANGVGDPGFTHNIYMGHHLVGWSALRCTFKNCVPNGGHNIKSRAGTTTLNQVSAYNSNGGREMDIPNGGIVHVTDCSFVHLSTATQNDCIRIAGEGTDTTRPREYIFRNCNFSNGRDNTTASSYIWHEDQTVPVQLIDCTFTGPKGQYSSGGSVDPLVWPGTDNNGMHLVGTATVTVTFTGGPVGPRVPVGYFPVALTPVV